ncbi:SipW-dependent-type signal peptide-containing protein, partial [Cryobacterium roopkundense]
QRRIRAVLAGGLVLGVGAAVTLAAWNDSEFAQGSFAAGAFNLVGSTNGTTFTDNPNVDAPASLGFTVDSSNLTPTDVVYAPFAVQLDATTTTDAQITLTQAATGGTVANLSYSVIQSTAFGCDATTTGTELVPAATPLGSDPATVPTFSLSAGADAAAGAPAYLCFAVTAGADLAQLQAGTATWQLTAASL